jgi:diguanylate cyclase (GGDEF)-like protein
MLFSSNSSERTGGNPTTADLIQMTDSRAVLAGFAAEEVQSLYKTGPWNCSRILVMEAPLSWRRAWPFALGFLLIASALYAIYRWQLCRISRHSHQLENLVSARTIELAIANADLERLSITDPLTGLKNRRYVEFSIAEDLARARRSFQYTQSEWHNPVEGTANIGFLLIDIDHFKQVNDRYGHPAGDRVLRQMGSTLSSVVRESDTTVRWGGEEFLIIARSPKGNDPANLAERLRKKVESAAFSVSDEQTIKLTCSIGFSSWPFFPTDPDAVSWQDVLELADRSLYLAKNIGRNAWIGVSISPDYKGKADTESLNDFRAAAANGIIRIQSSAAAEDNEQSIPHPPRQAEESSAFHC